MSLIVSADSYQSADPGSITQIVLNKTTAEIRNGEELQIVAKLNAGAEENLVWESSDESVVAITRSEDNLTTATVTGIKGGNATITAKSPDGSVKATCVVTVIQYISEIKLDKETAEVVPGGSIELTATVDEGSVDKLYWESSDESVATIEVVEDVSAFSTGKAITTSGDVSTVKINALKPGNVTITARNEDGNISAECEVTVIKVTNTNIGEYIDLGLSLVGTTATTDDWRILWVDEEEGKVYAMLNDYLPNNVNGKNYARLAGLNTPSTYTVNSTMNRDDLVNKLKSNWEALATDLRITGATVAGGPTGELLQLSYNYKNDPDIVYTNEPTIGGNMLVKGAKGDAYGYWLASANEGDTFGVWGVLGNGYVYFDDYDRTYGGVCPVVCLPSDINVQIKNGIWTVEK